MWLLEFFTQVPLCPLRDGIAPCSSFDWQPSESCLFFFFARVGLKQAFPKQCRLTPNLIFHCWQARHLLHFQRQMIPRVQMYKSQARPCYNTPCICTGVSELPNKSSHSVSITASGGAGLHMDHGKWKPHRCWSVTSTLKNGVGRPRSALAGWWASKT